MIITTVGILVSDIIAAELPSIANPGEVVFTPRGIKLRIGGHPANVSIDLVKLGFKGDSISLIGAVGKDIFGKFIEETLHKYGIKTHLQYYDIGTSKNIILVVRGEDRRFHVEVGANRYLDPKPVYNIIREEKPRIFYVGATGWLGKFDDKLEDILRYAKENGSITFVDIIAPYGKDWDYIISSLKYTDIFHCNNVEASNITGEKTIEGNLVKLYEYGVKFPIITLGKDGLQTLFQNKLIKMPAFQVIDIDPTGAGDAFCAGILYEIINKNYRLNDIKIEDFKEILVFASAVGASATTEEGTTEGVRINFIRKIIKEQEQKILQKTRIKEIKYSK